MAISALFGHERRARKTSKELGVFFNARSQHSYTHMQPVVTIKTKGQYECKISLNKLTELGPYFYNMAHDANLDADENTKTYIPIF